MGPAIHWICKGGKPEFWDIGFKQRYNRFWIMRSRQDDSTWSMRWTATCATSMHPRSSNLRCRRSVKNYQKSFKVIQLLQIEQAKKIKFQRFWSLLGYLFLKTISRIKLMNQETHLLLRALKEGVKTNTTIQGSLNSEKLKLKFY